MKRRTLLKGLSALAGGAIYSNSAWSMPGVDDTHEPGTPLAVPIRGLIRKEGKLLQLIQISIPHFGPEATVITRLNGDEVDRRKLATGWNDFSIGVEPVSATKSVRVGIEIDGDTTFRVVTLEPVRRIKVYVLPHSHHDLGYTDLQAQNGSRASELYRRSQEGVGELEWYVRQ
jgi:alpha-mannosidase